MKHLNELGLKIDMKGSYDILSLSKYLPVFPGLGGPGLWLLKDGWNAGYIIDIELDYQRFVYKQKGPTPVDATYNLLCWLIANNKVKVVDGNIVSSR